MLAFVALTALPLFLAGCASTSKTAEDSRISDPALFAALTTTELETRRATVAKEIAAIEREVEMKAGLHMGVAIGDERGRLSELYREATSIERELLRRSAYTRL
jgi:hypothetical protein